MDQKSGLLKGTNGLEQIDQSLLCSDRPLRVALVQPPALHGVRSLLSQVTESEDGIGFKPPLGLLYVATFLKANSDHHLKVFDCQVEKWDIEQSVEEILAFKPDVVGISAWTDWWYPSYEIGRRIKEKCPEVHLSYGGPHIGIYPEETLNISFVDSVVVGDGEVPFFLLTNLVSRKQVRSDLAGLHFKQTGISHTNLFYIHKDLDQLGYPDRTLLPIEKYGSVLSKGDFVTTMITSRGCPYKCTFCKLNFQKTLCRSPESVLEEFRAISALGIREVEIYDDTFTWSKDRVLAICDGIKHEHLPVKWAIRDRVRNAREDLLSAMKDAGCERIHYGIESGSDHVLSVMKKSMKTDDARAAISLAKKFHFTILTYFMFGNLEESLEDMEKTIQLALELDTDFAEFSITIPYAGTEMYDEGLRRGIIPIDFWSEYARSPVPDFEVPYLIESVASKEQLASIRDEAIRRFYFRPRYLWRQAMNVNSFGEFRRKAGMGLSLFRSAVIR